MKNQQLNVMLLHQLVIYGWLLSCWLIDCNLAAIAPNSDIPSIYTYSVDRKDDQQQVSSSKSISNYSSLPGYYQRIDNNRNYYYTVSNNKNNNDKVDTSYSDAMPTVVVDGTMAPSLPSSSPSTNGCTLDRLAVYKVVLHTYWTRDLFPKHYPDWRPSAQWTKTIGRSHDSSFALFHMGQQATQGVKQFAETGKSDILESSAAGAAVQQQQHQLQQSSTSSPAAISITSSVSQSGSTSLSQSKVSSVSSPSSKSEQTSWSSSSSSSSSSALNHVGRNVFDEFSIPAITTGDGRSETKFFVDSNHSLVSLMTRIVPSPDWFIGVDSFQLCVGGSWIDTVTIEMDPLDAGTDNGFTFTAPNWPTNPQGVIYRITSRYPAHPAGSFFYPKSRRLPPIATFQFIKLKEYELSEVFNFAEDDRKYETVKTQTHLETEHNHVEMNNELSASIERERQNEVTPAPTFVTEHDRIRSRLLAKMNPMNNRSDSIIPKNDKKAIIQNIANTYSSSRKHQKRPDKPLTSPSHRSRRPRDCRVSHWSEWSSCSKACGIGEMHRYRKIIRHGKRGGRPCPPLQQSKWCGSEKGCHSPLTYFNWSNT